MHQKLVGRFTMKNRYYISFQKEVIIGDSKVKTVPVQITAELCDPTLLAMQQKYGPEAVDKAMVEKMYNILKEKISWT